MASEEESPVSTPGAADEVSSLRIRIPKRYRWPGHTEQDIQYSSGFILKITNEIPAAINRRRRLDLILQVYEHLTEQPLLIANSAVFRATILQRLDELKSDLRRELYLATDASDKIIEKFEEMMMTLHDHPLYREE